MEMETRGPELRPRAEILGVGVSAITMRDATDTIEAWIAKHAPHYVCITGVHGIMESQRDSALRDIHNAAGLVTPDGIPLVWITFHGPYFWSRKGFGVNLAEDDGIALGEDGGPSLLSPYNSHLIALARAGVPGFVLWCLVGLDWLATMLRYTRLAWRRGQKVWGNSFLFVARYWLAIVVDARFDVALEGPLLGVWFWCLPGFCIGSVFQTDSA